MKSISTKGMSREDWLALRRNGIGGSDAAAVLGLSRWKSPFSVYCDKIGLGEDTTSTVMEMGNILEPYVADLFTKESGLKVTRRNMMFISDEHPCMVANIDRAVLHDKAGLECKTTTKYNRSGWDEGEIPPEYYWQCMHYMAVLGLDHWYLAVLFRDTGAFKWFKIERDGTEIAKLIEAEEAFWQLVVKRTPPPTSGLESETEELSEMYPASTVNGETADLSEVYTDLGYRAIIQDEIAKQKKVVEAIDQKVKRLMGSNQYGQAGEYVVSWPAYQKCEIDRDKLRTEYPQVFAAVSSMTDYRRMTIKKLKEAKA